MQKDESEIDYCPQCRGVRLDRGEIDKIAHVQNEYEDAHYRNIVMGEMLSFLILLDICFHIHICPDKTFLIAPPYSFSLGQIRRNSATL